MKFSKYENMQNILKESAVYLFVMQMFGYENYIYNSPTVKNMRIAAEHSENLKKIMQRIEDHLLEELKLSNEYILYSDGVYSYMILPESAVTESIVEGCMKRVNDKLLENFHTELFVGFGFCKCSKNVFDGWTEGIHCDLLNLIFNQISEKNSRRYSAQQIIWLNTQENKDQGQVKALHMQTGKVAVCRISASEFETTLPAGFFVHNIERLINGKKAEVIHNGGYDILVWGEWNDVFQFALDLQSELNVYKQDYWPISCGINIFSSSYPVHAMAEETKILLETSKCQLDGNVITLFDCQYSFSWDRLLEKVINEKIRAMETYFSVTKHHGCSFLQNLIELLRDSNEEVNFIRYVYLLARMEPKFVDKENYQRVRLAYHHFSRNMYHWSKTSGDREELITAIYIYLYKNKKKV